MISCCIMARVSALVSCCAAQETADTQKEADAAVGERDRLSALLVRRNEELAKATEKVCAMRGTC